MNHRNLVAVGMLAMLLPLQAHAACKEKLAQVDEQLATTELDASIKTAVQQFRDQAASMCDQGHEPTANQVLQMVDMMLAQASAEQSAEVKKAAPPPAPVPVPVEKQLAASVDFPNRWDKLSKVDACQWLTIDELEKALTFHSPLACRKTRKGFIIETSIEGDDYPAVPFMLIIEVHPGQKTVRKAEADVSEGFATKLFTPFDAGTSEVNVYLSNKGHYLYAFPVGGLSLWRLQYLKPSAERDKYYSPSPGRSGNPDLGPRFMEMLVDKFADRL